MIVSCLGASEMSKGLNREVFSDIVRALAFASRKHSQQKRKDADASPYINHPIALVSILTVEAGIYDRDTLCAALLHDTIEDTDTTAEELVETFGSPVASVVQEVTDDKKLTKAERKRRQVEHAAHLSPKASAVKLADKIANLRDVADTPPVTWSLSRRQEYFDWAKQVVDNIPQSPARLLSLFKAAYDRKP
jgi:GTP diphosphokinase / guanosine-3',5'-bis(diphosphate) 3'-diphosphatase